MLFTDKSCDRFDLNNEHICLCSWYLLKLKEHNVRYRELPSIDLRRNLFLYLEVCLSFVKSRLDFSWTLQFDLSISVEFPGLRKTHSLIQTVEHSQWWRWHTHQPGDSIGFVCSRNTKTDIYLMWIRWNCLTHCLWRQVRVNRVSNRLTVLHLLTLGPITCLPSSPPGLICDDQESCSLSPAEVDTDRTCSLDCQMNSDTTVFQFQCLSTKRCNLMLCKWHSHWGNSHFFWANFLNLCKYVSESIRPINIQSSEDSHQSTQSN